jgi:DNA-binding transcriptional regulator YhcF (GntR family)
LLIADLKAATINNQQSAISNLLNMHIELKDLSHNPVYAQVREQIEAQIKSKAVSSGDSLPSPAALASKLSVDKGEIQRAYFELEQSGLIKKQTGKDMFGKPKVTYSVA